MWNELWERHRGKLTGLIVGLLLSLIYLFAGFWDMLVVAMILLLGYALGKRADDRTLGALFANVLEWLNDRWRLFK